MSSSADLVYGNRILADQGVLDGFGHVSLRDANDPSRFLLARSMAPALVTATDIMAFDSEGNALDGKGRAVYLERFIHAAIYRARPDVMAVVHSHSLSVIPFADTGSMLRPMYHMSSFLGEGAPIFDIHDVAGDTDMLVSDNGLGDALAGVLRDHAVVLMRGHGFVAVGNSVMEAVFRSVYTQLNAHIQATASTLGTIKFLAPGEAIKATATNQKGMGRAWKLWKQKVDDSRASLQGSKDPLNW